MVIDKIFSTHAAAVKYLDENCPIPYSNKKYSEYIGKNGFYTIYETQVLDQFDAAAEGELRRQQILRKLSKEEREILGV